MANSVDANVSERIPLEGSLFGQTDVDPFPFYERARSSGSPVWDAAANGWLILDYDQCVTCERDESRFANAYVFADDLTRRIKGGGANITLSRDAEHMALRRFHLKLLTPGSVKRYRDTHIAPIVEQLVDGLAGRERVDLCAAVSDQVPPRVICSLLGMPSDDQAMMARILHLNERIVDFIASGYRDADLQQKALQASDELNAMLLPFVRMRRDDPQDDFISRVWHEAPAAGLDLDEEGVLGLCRELYFAGSDTTVHGIANALWVLLSRPDLVDRLKVDRGKMLASLIEESLRLLNVVQFRHRICMEETQVDGVTIQKGQTIFLVHAAANRDPARFGCPAGLDVERSAPTDHLAFAKGTRSCVGAQLARAEMTEVLDCLLDRFPMIRLDPDAPAPQFKGLFMRSMGPLHVILH